MTSSCELWVKMFGEIITLGLRLIKDKKQSKFQNHIYCNDIKVINNLIEHTL